MNVKIDVMIPESDITARIKELAAQISRDYEGRTPHVICVLKGSVYFTAELTKYMTVPVTMDFMSVSSYGNETSSTGIVRIVKDLDEPIEGRDVLVIEDILDSGRTLSYLMNLLRDRRPASLRLATLLDKPDRRIIPVTVDYRGFVIENNFVVGCGMDYQQRYRNLPYVGSVTLEED